MQDILIVVNANDLKTLIYKVLKIIYNFPGDLFTRTDYRRSRGIRCY